jgi:tRNA A-37 threonylcarbamoyl transferase component Bud32/predicted anti-sigma-YlaC factor YlaD
MPENAPEGLCLVCLAKVALGSEPAAQGGTINVSPQAEAAAGSRVPPSVAELAPQFPQLEILELLGMGGMGMVYKARQPRLDRFVALKILPVDSAAHPSFAERFNREAKALAKLNHPGIVDVYDFGQTGQHYYFIMEYVDGMNLRQLLNDQPVTPRQALDIVVQICTALQFAHDEGVVHRDIKPENILLNKKGQVKIADFGLAKLLGAAPDTALTMSQAAMGTFNYMAPEQRENAQKVDHRADIYSLGVVFYEMLTGEVPMGRFEPPSKRVQVDVRLDEVVLKALEREPARRYQHVSEVKSNVETITSTPPTAPAAPPAAPGSASRRPTFANLVVQPMIVLLLLWLASWCFARNWSYFFGMSLLLAGLPSILVSSLVDWRCKVASEGLRWRQLPPTVRRRCNRRTIPMAVACVAAFVIGMAVFPSRTTEWRQEWFSPKSRSYEKIGLSGNITGYQIPFWSKHSVAGSGTMALRIYRKDSTPAALTFSLPGLRVENDSRDPGQQPPGVLTIDVLTNWLRDSAQLDVAQPQVQAEARQLMELFEPYREVAPPSWDILTTRAVAGLRDFKLGVYTSTLAQFGASGSLFFAHQAFPGACVCLFYFLAFPSLKRAFAEGRAEIQAGRLTPPKEAPKRFLYSDILSVPLFLLALFAAYLAWQFIGVLLFLGILLAATIQLSSRRQIQQARENGLWPQLGELATLDHVKGLAQAGEKMMAIKLYRQIYGASLADAKATVEKLAQPSTTAHKTEAPPAIVPPAPPVSSHRRMSKMALAGAAWAFACLPFALISLVIAEGAQFVGGGRPDSAFQMLLLLIARWGTFTSRGTPLWQTVLEITILAVGLTAPFGVTILGYAALTQILDSAGRLYGLGMALFDALFFPLLIVDGLIFVLALFIMSAFATWLGGPLPANTVRDFGPAEIGLAAVPSFLISVVLDFFVVRKAWRSIRRKSEI